MKLFPILALLINIVTFVQAQNIEGEWTPDESSYLGETMTAYYTFRSEYLKNGTPMFYQELGKGDGMNYTKW